MSRGTNWAAVIAGLAALGISAGVIYYGWTQGWFDFLFGCTEGATKCVGTDRYTCQGGKWVLTMQGAPECQNGNGGGDYGCHGTCYYEGITACSTQGALCKCVDHAWQLFEQDSQLCIPQAPKHKTCFNSYNNIITCLEIPGQGNDNCYDAGYSGGCPCNVTGICDEYHVCVPSDNRCIRKAYNKFIQGTKSTPENDLFIIPDKPFAANYLTYTKVWYQGANPYMDTITWSLYAVYNGIDTLLCDGIYTSSGETGWFWIPANFPHEQLFNYGLQGFEGLRLNMSSGISNVNPQALQGTFTFQ